MDYECSILDVRNKRKHITLTIQEKLEVINLVESGISRQVIADRFGIGKSTVHDIHKRKDVIKNFASQNTTELSKRRRVDIKSEIKLEDQFVEELVENFDHEEFDYNEEEEYEIIEPPLQLKPDLETSSKRKSKTLTLREKWDILVQLDEGKAVSAIINKYGIGRTTLYDLKKQRQKIFEYIENSNGENRRTFKKSNYPEIEKNLQEFCQNRDCYTEQEFFDKYKSLFVALKSQNSSVKQSPFSGSWSWCTRFFDRNPEYKKKLISSKDFNASMKRENKSILKLEPVTKIPSCRLIIPPKPSTVDIKKLIPEKITDPADIKQDQSIDLDINDISYDECETIENVVEDSLEYIETDFIGSEQKPNKFEQDEFGNEYIIEELDDNELEMSSDEEQRDNSKRKENNEIVNHEEAMSSLKLLIKYSEQRGHDEISSLLIDYFNILTTENSV